MSWNHSNFLVGFLKNYLYIISKFKASNILNYLGEHWTLKHLDEDYSDKTFLIESDSECDLLIPGRMFFYIIMLNVIKVIQFLINIKY